MDLFIKKATMKVAGRRINEDPGTWQAEITKSIVNDHPYVSLDGAQVKFKSQDVEQQRAYGAVVFKNGSAALFSIRPEPLRGKPELDPVDVLFHRGRLRHLNEQSYAEASSVAPDLMDPNKNKNYGQPSSGNDYVGKNTGDQSPLSTYGNPSQMLGGPGLQSVRTASCMIGKIITNEDMLARLDRTLLTFEGLGRVADIHGIRASINASGEVAMRESNAMPSAAMLSRVGLNFFITYPSGEVKQVTVDDLKSYLGSNFKPIMDRVMASGRVPIQSNVMLESVDAKGLRSTMPFVTSNGTYHVRLFENVTVPMRVYTRVMSFGGATKAEQVAYHPSGMWARSSKFDGLKTTEDQLFERVERFDGPSRYMNINNSGKQAPNGVLNIQEGRGYAGGRWLDRGSESLELRTQGIDATPFSSREPLAAYADKYMTPPIKPKIGATFMLHYPEHDMVSPVFVLSSVREMPGSKYPLFVCKDEAGREFGYRLYESIGTPTLMPIEQASLLNVNGPVYMVPANSSPIPLAAQPFEVTPLSTIDKGWEAVKIARLGQGYWKINDTTMRDESQFLATVAHLGFDENVFAKCATLKPNEEYVVQVNMRGADFDAYMQSRLSTKQAGDKRAVLKTATYDLLKQFKRAADEVAQGADQVAKNAPEEFDAKTIDGLLMMQFADQENMIEIVQAAPMFEEVEHKVAQMLLAARAGKEMLDEDGLTRALRGMGDANKALSMLRLELEVEGVL